MQLLRGACLFLSVEILQRDPVLGEFSHMSASNRLRLTSTLVDYKRLSEGTYKVIMEELYGDITRVMQNLSSTKLEPAMQNRWKMIRKLGWSEL